MKLDLSGVSRTIRIALILATLYSIVAIAIVILRGGVDSLGVVAGVIVAYYAAAVGAGALVGLLGPLVRGTFGAIVVGIIACIPIAFAICTFLYGFPSTWSQSVWITVPAFSVIFGSICGPMARQTFS